MSGERPSKVIPAGVKVLFLGEYTGFAGGIERYAFQTACVLRSHGARVDWCGSVPARDGALFRSAFDAVLTPDEVADAPYDLAALHKLPTPELLHRWRELFGERLVFWAHDHDLYCPRHHYYTPFGRINCHRAYAPFRCALCSRVASPRSWRFLRRGQSELLAELRTHRAVVLSQFMRDNLLRNGFAPEQIHLVPPVIELPGNDAGDTAPTAGEAPLKILFLGQLIRGKGADQLLDALARLTVPYHARIVGDGKDRAMLERKVRAAGLRERVEFSGWLTDPKPALAWCDAVVFPSRWQEPFGLAGAEGSAHGKPVVAFDTGGVREWLEDGVNGFLVPEGDTAAMAEKLDLLRRDPGLRRKMGMAGRELVRQRFAPERFLDDFRALLTEGAAS